MLHETGFEVEDPGGRESEAVRIDGHRRHAAISTAASSGRCLTPPNRPEGEAAAEVSRVGDRGVDGSLPDRSHLCRHPPEAAIRGGCPRWLSEVAVCNLLKLQGLWFGWRF